MNNNRHFIIQYALLITISYINNAVCGGSDCKLKKLMKRIIPHTSHEVLSRRAENVQVNTELQDFGQALPDVPLTRPNDPAELSSHLAQGSVITAPDDSRKEIFAPIPESDNEPRTPSSMRCLSFFCIAK